MSHYHHLDLLGFGNWGLSCRIRFGSVEVPPSLPLPFAESGAIVLTFRLVPAFAAQTSYVVRAQRGRTPHACRTVSVAVRAVW